MSDRLPPHAPAAEAAIIGCCLLQPVECIAQAQEVITSETVFYDVRNQLLWKSICDMEPSSVNIIVVLQKIKDSGNSLPVEYLNHCEQSVHSTAHLPVWLEMVVDKHIMRRILTAANAMIAAAFSSKSASEVLDAAESGILAIRPQRTETKGIRQLVVEAINKIEAKCASSGAITGLTTGLIELDKLSDGVHPSEVIVLAGFPSTGKTALAVNIAVKNAFNGIPVAIFSAEMRPVQLVVRSICSESRVNFHNITKDDAPKIMSVVKTMSKAPLYIQQSHGFSVGQIAAQARRLKQKHDIRLMVIDYIQLLSGKGDNREQEISSISKGIKAIAQELDIPIIALSQLNDDGKLRESRAIGQDADSVWKLENDGPRQPAIQMVKLGVDKCRDGSTGAVTLTFLKTFTRFEDAPRKDQNQEPYADL